MNKLSVFIFRRDLRLHDNTTLIQTMQESQNVLACFIFDPEQLTNNDFLSQNCIEFMLESLQDLQKQLKNKLYFFWSKPELVISKLKKEIDIDAVYFNLDYTPFSKKRDSIVAKTCKSLDIKLTTTHDALLIIPQQALNKKGLPYSIFSSFFKSASKISIPRPQEHIKNKFYNDKIEDTVALEDIIKKISPHKNKLKAFWGGTNQALKLLENISKLDKPDHTNLSAHIKFGTISIRSVYYKIVDGLGIQHALIRQLFWRDFYTIILYYFPENLGLPNNKKLINLKWQNHYFKQWASGNTGFPIVDAAMRELNATGYMNNRNRMIVATLLVKVLRVNWFFGEKYFAQKLVDYDPAVNNGNWQWISSTGYCSQPYFYIISPWLQQQKFDPNCTYIKQWIPELANVSNKTIKNWFKETKSINDYPLPIVNYSKEAAITKLLYKQLLKSNSSILNNS